MTENHKIILSDLKTLLSQKYRDELKDVVLFGSQLKGKATKDSDYDILIVLKNPSDWKKEREISDLCYEIELKYGIITDTHILSEDELNKPRGKQPIFENALFNGFHA
jgi:predicted nucleotidyltransferase